MSDFATVNDVIAISGNTYTAAELERIETLLPLICDTLRLEAKKVGKDLDEMAEDASYASVLKLVTCDVVVRAMRQTQTGDPLSQESQSANGYTWSGTYAIPGGRRGHRSWTELCRFLFAGLPSPEAIHPSEPPDPPGHKEGKADPARPASP